MRKSIQQYLKWLAPLSVAALVTACSGGGTVIGGSSSEANTGDLDKLVMVAPSSYPAGVAVNVPVVVTNNGTATINNLSYAIDANTTGGTISISPASATSCRIIAAQASCTLMAEIAASSHPGSFGIATSQAAVKSASNAFLASTVLSVNVNIGLVQMPTNISSGADGLSLYYPSTVVGNESGITQVIVTAVVSSANAGDFNTVQLVDNNGTPISYTVLSGNSGTGMTSLQYGSVVTFLVNVASGSTQVQFVVKTSKDGTNPSTATNPNTIVVTNPATPTGILSVNPNYFSLTPSYESQIVTLVNSGNGAISSLVITATKPLSEFSNNCGATLAAGSSCQYVVTFNKDIPEAGTSGVTIDYNDGTNPQSSTATVNYTGVDPIAGLTITNGGSSNFDFVTRTNTPTQTELVTLTNSGNSDETGFSFDKIDHFTTSTTNVSNPCSSATVLAPKGSCNINLVYNNSTVMASPVTTVIPVRYSFGKDKVAAHSSVPVTYQTLQSQAILAITPNPTTFAGIYNNGVESNTQILTLTNSGDEVAIITGGGYSGGDSALFTTVVSSGTCGGTLDANTSCTYSVKFGPASSSVAAGNKTTTGLLNYTPYSGASDITTQVTLNGQVSSAQSAVIAQGSATANGFAGGTGIESTPYQVQESATAPTLTYTLTNSGTVPATSFYISGTPSNGWTMSGCGTSVSPVTLGANGGSCTLTFTLNTATATAHNLDLSQLTMNWVDQDTPSGENPPMSGTVYANVYVPASVAVTTTPESGISIEPGESFNMTATLSGGYNVQAQTIHATTATAGMSFSNNDCALNSQNSYSCSISAVAAGNAESASSQIVTLSNSTTPAMVPMPSTVSFEIVIPVPIVPTIALPQTGQTPTAPIAATAGMDGYTYLGVPWAYVVSGVTTPPIRFTVGTGAEADCVTDNLTGLMWVESPSSATYKWRSGTSPNYTYPAQAAVESYNTNSYCGHNDWYLPTINDLASLLNDAAASPATWLNSQGFSNVQTLNNGYWSSTAYVGFNGMAWYIVFDNGNWGSSAVSGDPRYVWPVRLAQ